MSNARRVEMESVMSAENLRAAWASVRANAGAGGVDGKDIEATAAHLERHWPVIREKLLAGDYEPGAIRGAEIAKPGGGSRQLGIPTVQDRLIQQALQQELSAAFDPTMSEHSWGYRPGRSAHGAVAAAQGYVKAGKVWVVDIDLRRFFDEVNHDRLMRVLSERIGDKRVLRLIGRYLRAPLRQPDGRLQRRGRGVPQGGPLSPVLANLYLDALDRELEGRGLSFVRYADDVAVFVSSERAARRVLESVARWLRRHLDLEVNEHKSGTGRSGDSQLLGFRICDDGEVSLAPRTRARFKAQVRALWDARVGGTSRELRERWQDFSRGWWNYFRQAEDCSPVTRLSGWVRRHMRKCFWLRWHNRQGRRNALARLGVRGCALGVAGCRRGAWVMARHVTVQQALKNDTLARHGFTLPWQLAG